MSRYTPGTWKVGSGGGTVVSDAPVPERHMDARDLEYYGGELIAESIANPSDARLIAKAPQLLAMVRKLYVEATENRGFWQSTTAIEVRTLLAELHGNNLPLDDRKENRAAWIDR